MWVGTGLRDRWGVLHSSGCVVGEERESVTVGVCQDEVTLEEMQEWGICRALWGWCIQIEHGEDVWSRELAQAVTAVRELHTDVGHMVGHLCHCLLLGREQDELVGRLLNLEKTVITYDFDRLCHRRLL